nr:hypothetical protein [Bacillus pumilus]
MDKKPKTIVSITDLGKRAYKEYLSVIEAILKNK